MSDLIEQLKNMSEADRAELRRLVSRPTMGTKSIDYGKRELFIRKNKDGSISECYFNTAQPGFSSEYLKKHGWGRRPGPKAEAQ